MSHLTTLVDRFENALERGDEERARHFVANIIEYCDVYEVSGDEVRRLVTRLIGV